MTSRVTDHTAGNDASSKRGFTRAEKVALAAAALLTGGLGGAWVVFQMRYGLDVFLNRVIVTLAKCF